MNRSTVHAFEGNINSQFKKKATHSFYVKAQSKPLLKQDSLVETTS